MTWTNFGSIIGPVLAAVVAFVASEISRRVADARRQERVDCEAEGLAVRFTEFRVEVDRKLDKLFDKMDEVISKGPYVCSQLAQIGALKAQVETNNERFLRMEQRVHDIETGAKGRVPMP